MAGEYQKVDLYLEHQGKINVTGELAVPLISDLEAEPLMTNAIGMKDGILYIWNGTYWIASGSDSTHWTPDNTFSS